jgi:maltose O-acetyltransferase
MRIIFVALYYLAIKDLPHSTVPILGPMCERLREVWCRRIFKHCGTNVNIGKGARFGKGYGIRIGNNSGIGMLSKVPDNVQIGEDVMMGQNVNIIGSTYNFDRVDIPMRLQAYEAARTS